MAAQGESGRAAEGAGGRVRLRQVGPRELPALLAMVQAYHGEDGLEVRPDHRTQALAALAAGDPLARAWLVEEDGRTVGYVVLGLGFSIEAGGREACVDELYMVPEARGRGIGRRVLALVEEQAQALALKRLYLEVGHGNRAVELYRRAGFVDHGRYLMSKAL